VNSFNRWVVENISFDVDLRVHLFETNIRVLGGLLSSHLLAKDPRIASRLGFEYEDELLNLAIDLGERLLLAFDTDTKIPYAWVNLRHGVEQGEVFSTCTAGVGTLILEFGTLSYLSNDKRFYDAAYDALIELWGMRSQQTGLIGNSFELNSKQWTNDNAGIGSGIDSFYEYLLKSYTYFGDDQFFEMFEEVMPTVPIFIISSECRYTGQRIIIFEMAHGTMKEACIMGMRVMCNLIVFKRSGLDYKSQWETFSMPHLQLKHFILYGRSSVFFQKDTYSTVIQFTPRSDIIL
jgi:hypothetical protein